MLGIIFALLALICWGFGDFFIQRTSREFGVWPSTFCITAAGALILFPFVFKSLPTLFSSPTIWLLLALGVGTLIVGLVTFDALKLGKISVIEPIMSFELPLTVLLVVIILRENITSIQTLLIAFVFGGILLVGYTGNAKARHLLEKGALMALLAALLQAGVNIATGFSSQEIGPVETIWFVHTFVAIICVFYFSFTNTWHGLVKHVGQHPYETTAVAILDNAAWVFYAFATTLIPISLAITISESYIILTIILGVIINKEKLLHHQWVGVILSLVAVIILSSIS